MSNGRKLGFVLIVLGVVLIILGAVAGPTEDSKLNDRFTTLTAQQATDAGLDARANTSAERRWSCGKQDPIEVGRQLKDLLRARAYNESEGSAFLRTKAELYIVQNSGVGTECIITREDLGGRYSNGHFIYLGPGFGPSSPSSGSGGSAGSFGGAK